MTGTHERGDYRMRRVWPLWVVERRWQGGWDRIGLPMRCASAHAMFHELDDWQRQAAPETRSIMRGEVILTLPGSITEEQAAEFRERLKERMKDGGL